MGGSLGGSLGGLQVEALEAATQKYAEDILVLVTQDKFMGELSETMAVPIYIISRPVLQEVIIFAPSPPWRTAARLLTVAASASSMARFCACFLVRR